MSSSTCKSSNSSSILTNPKPESRFSRPTDSGGGGGGGGCDGRMGVTIVDSKSCRQMYLRTAYKFTREEDSDHNNSNKMEKAKNCLVMVKERFNLVYKRDYDNNKIKLITKGGNDRNKVLMVLKKVKEISFDAFLSLIIRMLACTSKVGVVEH